MGLKGSSSSSAQEQLEVALLDESMRESGPGSREVGLSNVYLGEEAKVLVKYNAKGIDAAGLAAITQAWQGQNDKLLEQQAASSAVLATLAGNLSGATTEAGQLAGKLTTPAVVVGVLVLLYFIFGKR